MSFGTPCICSHSYTGQTTRTLEVCWKQHLCNFFDGFVNKSLTAQSFVITSGNHKSQYVYAKEGQFKDSADIKNKMSPRRFTHKFVNSVNLDLSKIFQYYRSPEGLKNHRDKYICKTFCVYKNHQIGNYLMGFPVD